MSCTATEIPVRVLRNPDFCTEDKEGGRAPRCSPAFFFCIFRLFLWGQPPGAEELCLRIASGQTFAARRRFPVTGCPP